MNGEDVVRVAPVTLAGFYAARLDEAEAAAKAANGLSWLEDAQMANAYGDHVGDSWVINEHMHLFETDTATAVHIARHDPARVLRGVAAGRAILAEIESELADDPSVVMPQDRLRHLAAVYSDHPGYRQEWAP